MLYDIPGRTGTPISTPTLLRLARHEHILAVKDAKGDLTAGSEVMAATELAFYSGDDANNLAWLALGAIGVVSVVAHVAAGQYAEMVAAVGRSDLPAALAVHRQLLPVVRAVMDPRLQGAITAKAVLHAQGVIASRATRPPLMDATDAQVAELRAALTAAGVAP
jgi:4-hydroxy-tetrahydrodipicolinate synthase